MRWLSIMKISKLSVQKYAEFKTALYKLYLKNIDNPNKNYFLRKRVELNEKYHSEYLNQLFDSTVAFPFDLELSNYLYGKNLSKETFKEASIKLGIDESLIKTKIQEYMNYNISYINGIGLIDQEVVGKLSEVYATRLYAEDTIKK